MKDKLKVLGGLLIIAFFTSLICMIWFDWKFFGKISLTIISLIVLVGVFEKVAERLDEEDD